MAAHPGETYGDVLTSLAPGSIFDIATPADEGSNLPDAMGLEGYDGVAITGSALHLWEKARSAAAGGTGARGLPLEDAILRFMLGLAGRGGGRRRGCADEPERPRGLLLAQPFAHRKGFRHPLMAGRPMAFDAPCVHLDIVTIPPGEVDVLASNENTPIQAAEFRNEGGTFWGVQYHPEFDLKTLGVIMKRYAPILLQEGKAKDEAQAAEFANDLLALHEDRSLAHVAWRYGIGEDILDDARRLTEIRNFIEHRVKPAKSERGRA